MNTRWTPTFSLAQLAPGGARLFKHGTTQVAIFRLADGQLRAVDNRCPHQGYPLLKGGIVGEVLTCAWHNFKFDLRDGACIMGEEGVRAYPVRVVDEVVEIDLAPPPGLAIGLWEDLEAALHNQETGRAARDAIRLLDLGVQPAKLALAAAVHDARHCEYGPSHALPLACEVGLDPGASPELAVGQALDLAGRSNLRRPLRPVPEPSSPGEDPVAAGERLRALVEAEDGRAAEALVRGAVQKSWGREEIQPWFFALCADHFINFGHSLIYSVLVFDLLDQVGWEGAEELLGALVWSISNGTREDLLPPWMGWRRRIAEEAPESEGTLDPEALVEADAREAFALVASSADPHAALAIAAAERLLRFDLAHDQDPTLSEGWLAITHRQTFVDAVFRSGTTGEIGRRLRLQAAQFVAAAQPLDGPRPFVQARPSSLEEVVAAVAARAGWEAVERAAGYLQDGGEVGVLSEALVQVALRDQAVRAIFLAHHVKNLRAGARESAAIGDPRPMLAAVRFVASPLRERGVERAVHEAVELVRHGRPPRTLTS